MALAETMVSGAAYGITGGKALVNGVAYSIKQGKTLVNGVAYDIGGEIEAPTQAELWADVKKIDVAGVNSPTRTALSITAVIPTPTYSGIIVDPGHYVFSFCNGAISIYYVVGTYMGADITSVTGLELIYSYGHEGNGPGAIYSSSKIHFTTSTGATSAGTAYGATLLRVAFPSYTKEQVAAAFENLAYASEGDGLESYAGRNSSSAGTCSKYSAAFVNCEVMFAVVYSSVKVYTSGLGNQKLSPTFQTDKSATFKVEKVPNKGIAYRVTAVSGSGASTNTYGASLIGLKEAI